MDPLRAIIPAPLRALRWRLPWMRRTDAFARTPAAAALRAARFTLHELARRDFAFRTPDGLRLTTMPNNFSSFAMCIAGARDPGIWRFVERHVPAGGCFVDAGANIGAYAVPAARLVGPQGRLLAFEAHPRTFGFLAANLAGNGLGWAEPLNLALGEAEGEIRMAFVARNPGETHVAADGEDGARVPMLTLDAALAARGVGAVDYLKIDVEGFELPVLRGARRTLDASPRIAVQVEMQEGHATRYGHGMAAIAELLHAAGLAPHTIGEDGAPRPVEGALRGDIVWLRAPAGG